MWCWTPKPLFKHLNTLVYVKCNFTISIFTRIISGINFQSQHILLHQYIIKICFYWLVEPIDFRIIGFSNLLTERCWWRLLQKRVVYTKLDIYVFIIKLIQCLYMYLVFKMMRITIIKDYGKTMFLNTNARIILTITCQYTIY